METANNKINLIKEYIHKELPTIHLCRLRLAIKKHLAEEMKEIDKLVKKVVG